MVTFFLGLGVGATLCYAFLSVSYENLPDPSLRVSAPQEETSTPPPPPPPVQEETYADLDGLWPAEHLFVGLSGRTVDAAAKAWLGAYRPGGVVLRPSNLDGAAQTKRLISSIKEGVGLGTGLAEGPFIFTSQDGGPLNPLKATDAPSLADLGAAGNRARVRDVASGYAAMARAQGFSCFLSPALDVYAPNVSTSSLAGLSFGTSAEHVTTLAGAFVEGVSQEGLLAVVKHYPGLGAARVGNGGAMAMTSPELAFIAGHMLPFKEMLRKDVSGVLVAPIAVPGIDTEHSTRPAMYSPKLVDAILREQWKFNGVVLSDNVTDAAADTGIPLGSRVVQALVAGCDAVMLLEADGATMKEVCRAILTARDEGVLPVSRLEESKRRLDRWRQVMAATASREVPEERPAPAVQPPNTELLRHTIQPSETLDAIARKYAVSVADLKGWNALTDDRIEAGKKLKVYLPREVAVPAQEVEVEAPAPAPPEVPREEDAPVAMEEQPEPSVEAPREEESVVDALPEEAGPAEESSEEKAAEEAAKELPPPGTVRREHTVARGDTLTDLVKRYGVTMADVVAWNALKSPELLADQKLVLYVPEGLGAPAEGAAPAADEGAFTFYVVKPGETLHRIAVNHNTTAPALAKMNNLPRPDHVFVGQRLKVPAAPEARVETKVEGEATPEGAAPEEVVVQEALEAAGDAEPVEGSME